MSFVVTALAALICLPAVCAFARLDFTGRNGLFLTIHAFLRFGLPVSIATKFLTTGLVDTFWGMVLIQLITTLVFMIWIPTAAFQNVDLRLQEPARNVGAGPVRVFWSVTLPQAYPPIARQSC